MTAFRMLATDAEDDCTPAAGAAAIEGGRGGKRDGDVSRSLSSDPPSVLRCHLSVDPGASCIGGELVLRLLEPACCWAAIINSPGRALDVWTDDSNSTDPGPVYFALCGRYTWKRWAVAVGLVGRGCAR